MKYLPLFKKIFRLILVSKFAQLPFCAAPIRAIHNRLAAQRYKNWSKILKSQGVQNPDTIQWIGRNEAYKNASIGPDVQIDREVSIWISEATGANPELHLGARSYIGRHTYIGVHQPIHIGADVLIGAYCYLISANHNFSRRDIPIRDQGFDGKPIRVGDDAWFGTHVVVLPGVTIGRGAIIGAGSVVNCDVPAYEIWGGVPAKFLKTRPE